MAVGAVVFPVGVAVILTVGAVVLAVGVVVILALGVVVALMARGTGASLVKMVILGLLVAAKVGSKTGLGLIVVTDAARVVAALSTGLLMTLPSSPVVLRDVFGV